MEAELELHSTNAECKASINVRATACSESASVYSKTDVETQLASVPSFVEALSQPKSPVLNTRTCVASSKSVADDLMMGPPHDPFVVYLSDAEDDGKDGRMSGGELTTYHEEVERALALGRHIHEDGRGLHDDSRHIHEDAAVPEQHPPPPQVLIDLVTSASEAQSVISISDDEEDIHAVGGGNSTLRLDELRLPHVLKEEPQDDEEIPARVLVEYAERTAEGHPEEKRGEEGEPVHGDELQRVEIGAVAEASDKEHGEGHDDTRGEVKRWKDADEAKDDDNSHLTWMQTCRPINIGALLRPVRTSIHQQLYQAPPPQMELGDDPLELMYGTHDKQASKRRKVAVKRERDLPQEHLEGLKTESRVSRVKAEVTATRMRSQPFRLSSEAARRRALEIGRADGPLPFMIMVYAVKSMHLYLCESDEVTTTAPEMRDALLTYNEQGYGSMTQDVNRNARYEGAIVRAVESGKRRFIEIGPGAHACLTKLVLRAATNTRVIAVEGNSAAVPEARHSLRSDGFAERAHVIDGLSIDQDAIADARRRGPYDAVVHELVGAIAGCEGAALLVKRLHVDLGLRRGITQVPIRAMTFVCPCLLNQQHLNSPPFDVLVAKNTFAMIKRLAISDAQANTGGTGPEWLKSEVIELLDFESPHDLDEVQDHINYFVSETDAFINGLATFIYVETGKGTLSQRTSTTAYPYGATKNAPEREPGVIAFSSRVDDGSACAGNWRNVFIPLADVLHIPKGEKLKVHTTADLTTPTPSYRFQVSIVSSADTHYDKRIRKWCPTFLSLD